MKLHVDIQGTGEPLVLLHGWGWHSGIWQPLLPQLAENFQLFMIDLPGFGRNREIKTNYFIEEISAALLAAAPPHANWLGWSLGGMLAWEIALRHPLRVKSLITVASSPKFLSTENWPGVSPEVLNQFSDLLIKNAQQTLHDFLELQLRGGVQQQDLMPQLKEIFSRTEFCNTALQDSLQLLRTIDLRTELMNLTMPSLHIFGSHDTLVPVTISQYLKTGKCEVIKRSGHIPFLTQQENFLKILKNFLSSAKETQI